MDRNYILNAFKALAVADAVGGPLEFRQEISQSDVVSIIQGDSSLFITDDTQMSLFGLVALTEAYKKGLTKREEIIEEIKSAYVDWYKTQLGLTGRSWLSKEPLMLVQRAPGTTCISALSNLAHNLPVVNNSKGCGVVMRLLPFAILQGIDQYLAVDVAICSGHLTHHHPEIRETVIRYMEVALVVMNGGTIRKAEKPVSEYGLGWTSMECFEMGYAAFTRASDYYDLLVQSIAHSGDSDSVAAVAGSLWGLAGRTTPKELSRRIVEAPLIERVVDNFCNAIGAL